MPWSYLGYFPTFKIEGNPCNNFCILHAFAFASVCVCEACRSLHLYAFVCMSVFALLVNLFVVCESAHPHTCVWKREFVKLCVYVFVCLYLCVFPLCAVHSGWCWGQTGTNHSGRDRLPCATSKQSARLRRWEFSENVRGLISHRFPMAWPDNTMGFEKACFRDIWSSDHLLIATMRQCQSDLRDAITLDIPTHPRNEPIR